MNDFHPFPSTPEIWRKFASFELFQDHVSTPGARLAVRVGPLADDLGRLLGERAASAPPLDPDVAGFVLRAGLGLIQEPEVEAVHAVGEDALVVLSPGAAGRAGAAAGASVRLASRYAGTLSLLVGRPVRAVAVAYEFPDAAVLGRALAYFQETAEENTPRRSAAWLGAQLLARDQPFHPSMLDTLEEQTSLLEAEGVNLHDLPGWWWRGAAAVRVAGRAELLDPPPAGPELLARAVG